MSCKRNFTLSHIINPSMIKLVQSKSRDVGLLFCVFMNLDSFSVYKHAGKLGLGFSQPSGMNKLVSNTNMLLIWCSLCILAADFCWMCCGDWKNHGSEYYECSRYKSNPNIVNESAGIQAREALKKYLFYFERVRDT